VTPKQKSKLFTEKDLIRNSILKTQERFVLYLIHEHCGNDGDGFATQKTFARISGLSQRRVRRAIKWLSDNGIIEVSTKRKIGFRHYNNYRVNLSRLLDFKQTEAAPQTPDVKTDKPFEGHEEFPRGLTDPCKAAPQTPEPGVPQTPINEKGNEHIETKDAAVSETGSKGNSKESRKGNLPLKKSNGRKPRIGKIKPEEFQSLETGLKRFSEFVAAGHVQDNDRDRLRFLTQWVAVGEASGPDGKIESPAAVFVSNVKNGRWYGSNAQEALAKRFVIEHERSQPVEPNEILDQIAENQKAIEMENNEPAY